MEPPYAIIEDSYTTKLALGYALWLKGVAGSGQFLPSQKDYKGPIKMCFN